MNRKEKLINALKGLIGTVCIVVTAYCLMKYLNVKFHFLDIDNKPIDCDSFKVYNHHLNGVWWTTCNWNYWNDWYFISC